MSSESGSAAAAWDAEYAAGRYAGEQPVAFTGDILAAARQAGLTWGLLIHFFTSAELNGLFADGFTPVLPPRLRVTHRQAPRPGQWSQWEAIWRTAHPGRVGCASSARS